MEAQLVDVTVGGTTSDDIDYQTGRTVAVYEDVVTSLNSKTDSSDRAEPPPAVKEEDQAEDQVTVTEAQLVGVTVDGTTSDDFDYQTGLTVAVYEDVATSLNSETDSCDRMSDDDDVDPSSGSEGYEDDDDDAIDDDVTAQLVAAGPIGVAAAAAFVSSKKRKRPHSFETNPSIRKRHQNRLLKKLRQTIDEVATRVGQQAVVLVATPGKPNSSYKVFGAKPLEDVVKNLKAAIMEDLENALAQQAPPPVQDDPSLELPPLVIDGIPTPVEKMTQAQLRAFIPLILKSSTGRGKPGWGRESTRPPWWPKELPWANVRMDARSEDEKQKMPWTQALQQIVINCYKYHGQENLLSVFSKEGKERGSQSQWTDNVVICEGIAERNEVKEKKLENENFAMWDNVMSRMSDETDVLKITHLRIDPNLIHEPSCPKNDTT